jgi:lipoprotein signal peptidase
VFNFADFAISAGVALIVIYQKRFFGKKTEADSNEPVATPTEPTVTP